MLHDAILFAVSTKIYRCIVVQSLMLVDTHFDSRKARNLYQQGFLDWETVGRAIGDLSDAEGIDIKLGLVPPPMDLHFGRSPTKESLQRYKCIPEGGNRFDLQKNRPDITPDCWIRKKSGGTDLFGRL